MDLLGNITGALGELGSIVVTVTGFFAGKKLLKSSGGRDKKFSLEVIKKYATESFSREVCEFWKVKRT